MTGETRRDEHQRVAAELGFGMADWPALGTTAQVVAAEPAALPTARAAVEKLLEAVDLAASRFRSDSELAGLNSAGGRWVPVSPLFARALRVAMDAARWTDGLVDPTVGGALLAAGYDRTFAEVPTDGPALRVRIGPVPGWQQLELDEERQQARVPPGTLVDLGATAKGLAVDLCAQAAAAAGDCGVLVSLGGDMAVGGAAPRGGWPVTVTDLSDLSRPAHEGLAQVIGLSRGGLATSSTRARRWRRGGSELHHLIDPGSGVPVASPWRTVSVTAETCVLANTGSTAAIVLGDSAQRWLTERGLTARLVRRDGTVSYGVLRRQLAGAAARGRGAAPRGAMRLEWA